MNKLYLNGIYQAKSTSLIPLESFDNLRKLSGNAFIDYLKEISYVTTDSQVTIEDAFAYHVNVLKNEVNSLTNNSLFSNIFYLNNDLTNIKIVYKSIYYNIPIESEDHLSKYSIEALIEFFKHDNNSLIASEDLEILTIIKNTKQESMKKSLETIEKTYYQYYYEKALNFDSSLKLYMEYKIFENNLRLFLKLKYRNSDVSLLKDLLLDESFVGLDQWTELFELSNNEIGDYFTNNFYGKLSLGVNEYFNNQSLKLLNENLNSYLEELLLEKSFNNSNLGKVTYYLYIKELEMKTLRRLYYE